MQPDMWFFVRLPAIGLPFTERCLEPPPACPGSRGEIWQTKRRCILRKILPKIVLSFGCGGKLDVCNDQTAQFEIKHKGGYLQQVSVAPLSFILCAIGVNQPSPCPIPQGHKQTHIFRLPVQKGPFLFLGN